jgi:hypothetical protein
MERRVSISLGRETSDEQIAGCGDAKSCPGSHIEFGRLPLVNPKTSEWSASLIESRNALGRQQSLRAKK